MKKSKKSQFVIPLIILLLVAVSAIVWSLIRNYLNLSSLDGTSQTYYASQEECQRETNKICSFAQCDLNCGKSGGFKGWVPTGRNYRPTPAVWDEQACQVLEDEINGLLDQANSCRRDEDCKKIGLGCPFGCYNLVNDMSDTNSIGQAYREYQDNCGRCLYRCAADPKPEEIICKNNRCVDNR